MSNDIRAGAVVGFGVIYTVVYLFIVLLTIGGGEGTFLFATALITWPLIWICLAAQLLADRSAGGRMAIASIAVHYLVTLAAALYLELTWDWFYLKRYFVQNSGFCLFGLACYLGGQVILWSLIRHRFYTK